jgi:hypothetical protein
MTTSFHYCPILRALLVRLYWREHAVGFDVYHWLTGLSVFRWRGVDEVMAWDFGKVGG